jgi:hypothetical protein
MSGFERVARFLILSMCLQIELVIKGVHKMRKLFLILLALMLSIAMLVISVVPAMAAQPDSKQPVVWVNAIINTGSLYSDLDAPVHSQHTIEVKVLADHSVFGTYKVHDYLAGTKGWDVVNPYYPGMGLDVTFWWAYFWYDETYQANMVDIAFWAYFEEYPDYPAVPVRILIADKGGPEGSGWHKWWGMDLEGAWQPSFGGIAIPYIHGNVKIHGDLEFTGKPFDYGFFDYGDTF